MLTSSVRYSLVVLIGLSLVGIGWKGYAYFSDREAPEVALTGIEAHGYYAGDVSCVLALRDNYKVAEFSLYIDQKPLVMHVKVNKRAIEHRFIVPTVALANGQHELSIEACDGSHRANATHHAVQFFVDNEPLQAALVRPEGDAKMFQGKTLHLFFQVNKPIKSAMVHALGRDVVAMPEDPKSLIYESFIPVACEDKPSEYSLVVDIEDWVGNRALLDTKFQVVAFPFPHQMLKISQEIIDAEIAAGKEQRMFEARVAELTAQSPETKLWNGAFYAPIAIRGVSTPFGTVRETQHRGKYAHKAIDLLGEPKRVVWAPQDGVVVMLDRFAMSGNTVVIDHGCGILTLYFHLDTFAPLAIGDRIKQGNPIGTIGKTGFASGYHLHWELRVGNVPVDPMQWIAHDF